MTRLVSKENKTKSHWHFHYDKRRLYLLYLSLLFMDRMNYFHSNVCLCSHSVVPFSSISNQNQKSIYFTQKYVHKNMCGPFMTLQFGIPKAFYCLYPADIERYKLSFVSSIKWKIRLKVFISNKMWHLFIYMHPQKCTCIIVEEEIWRKNDDSGFLSSSNISTTFFSRLIISSITSPFVRCIRYFHQRLVGVISWVNRNFSSNIGKIWWMSFLAMGLNLIEEMKGLKMRKKICRPNRSRNRINELNDHMFI